MLNIAVCGKFHYPKYLKYLDRQDFLKNFYCSYKLGEHFGILPKKVNNLFIKEYLYNMHLRTLGERGLHEMSPLYHGVWQNSVKKIFKPAAINLFMIHGNCTDLIKLCSDEQKITIGEAVNAHPEYQDHLLKEEARMRGIRHRTNPAITRKMLAEFDVVDHLMVSSQFVKNTFIDKGYDKEKIITLPYGVDANPVAPAPTAAARTSAGRKTVKVLCVGQVCLRKGQYYLLDAIKRLNRASRDRVVELTLVGRPEPAYMKCLSSLNENFTYIRHVDNSEMTRFMAGFDIFVLPTLEDGFSVVVTEALAAGLPVVTTRNNGAADIITDGHNGVVVPAASAGDLQLAIERILDEKITGKRKKLSTWKDYACQLVETCENILAVDAYV